MPPTQESFFMSEQFNNAELEIFAGKTEGVFRSRY